MNILITGSTGFIGSRLVKVLVEEGHHCRCLARNLEKAESLFKDLKNVEIIKGDVVFPQTLKGISDSVDYVYHLAALRGHDLPSEEAFNKFRKINVKGLENVLIECGHNNSIKKIIYVGSTASYGIVKTTIISENTEAHPYTPYQVTKHEAERRSIEYYKNYKMPITILRPCMIYGPGFRGDFLTMARVAKLGVYPKIGRGKNLIPALYIDDLINSCIAALEKAKAGEVYLLGPGRSYSQDEIVAIFEKFFGKKIFRIFLPTWLAKTIVSIQGKIFTLARKKPIVTARNISSITTDRILDISKAKEELGFEPGVSLEEGLLNTLNWFKKEKLI